MSEQKKTNQINLVELLIKCREAFWYLVGYWKILILMGMLGGAAGILFSWLNKPVYTATLTFALEDEESSGGLSGALGLASQFGLDLGVQAGGAFVGSNLIELFKSRKMVEETLLSPVTINGQTISFAEMYIRDMGWRNQWAKNEQLKNAQFLPGSDRSKFTRAQDSVLGGIFAVLSGTALKVMQKDRELSIVVIELKSGDEVFAKYFTEALARKVSDFYVLTRNKKALDNLAILERQTDSIRYELNSSIMGVAASNDDAFNLNPALNVRRVPSSRKQVDVQVNGAMLVELVKQTELARVNLRKETPLIQIIDQPILPLKKERFGKLKGLIFFGFPVFFLTVLILLMRRFYKKHLA